MKAETSLFGCLLDMVSPFAFTHYLFSLIASWAGSVHLPINIAYVWSYPLFLMVNQVSSFIDVGIGAATLSSNKGIDGSLMSTSKGIQSGTYRLFSAPEAIVDSECWREVLLEKPLCH